MKMSFWLLYCWSSASCCNSFVEPSLLLLEPLSTNQVALWGLNCARLCSADWCSTMTARQLSCRSFQLHQRGLLHFFVSSAFAVFEEHQTIQTVMHLSEERELEKPIAIVEAQIWPKFPLVLRFSYYSWFPLLSLSSLWFYDGISHSALFPFPFAFCLQSGSKQNFPRSDHPNTMNCFIQIQWYACWNCLHFHPGATSAQLLTSKILWLHTNAKSYSYFQTFDSLPRIVSTNRYSANLNSFHLSVAFLLGGQTNFHSVLGFDWETYLYRREPSLDLSP